MPNLFDRIFRKEKSPSNVSALAIQVGSIVNQRYRLDEEIGRGGMGIIYRAHDLTLNKEIALKIINPETANSLSLGQFAREMEILSKLNHPHIVSVFETGFVNGDPTLPFLVMEYLKGKPLTEIGTLTLPRIVSITKQICEALAYIHEQGFVYRDIKPNNVLLEKRGFDYFIKLVDFGLARPRGEAYLADESSLAGTVFYLAPELVNGQLADIRSDLYALGILIYEMIVGRVPFFDIDEESIRLQHQNQQASPPSQSRNDVPLPLDKLVLQLLEKDPQKRPGSARDVLDALHKIEFASARGNLPIVIPQKSENELQPVIRLLEAHSLVTLIDNDHSLAFAVAARLAGQFSDGIWCIELEQVYEPTAVLPTVLSTFDLNENPNRSPIIVLIEFLREKNLLLALTHCGQISSACAQLAAAITSSCPDVCILAVSDKPLGLPNEYFYSSQSKIL